MDKIASSGLLGDTKISRSQLARIALTEWTKEKLQQMKGK